MDKKLALTNIIDEPDRKKYVFASYLKTDYIDKSLVINTDPEYNVENMIFSSNDYGIAEWESGKGIKDCHKWEDEDAAKASSSLSRRYTAIISNGNVTEEYAINKIVSDVLSHIEDKKFCDAIFETVSKKNPIGRINISEFALNSFNIEV
jgi:hypothetical protein